MRDVGEVPAREHSPPHPPQTKNTAMNRPTNRKPKPTKPQFEISNDLLPLLDGMESQNWSTCISKNNVKTITVTFKVRRPGMTVEARG